MMAELIDNPAKLVAYCNQNIKAVEAEMADAEPEIRLKLRNQLLGFTELLEKGLHQLHQQGYQTEDIAVGAPTKKGRRKSRFDAD